MHYVRLSIACLIACTVSLLVLTTPLSYAVVFQGGGGGSPGSGLPLNETAIQNQILTLQQKLAEAKALNAQREKALAEARLAPVLALDKQHNCAPDQHTPTTYITYLTHFSCGHVSVLANGTVTRKFVLIADDFHGIGKAIPITTNQEDTVTSGAHKFNVTSNKNFEPVIFHGWTFNNTVPGPTIRVTQGDHVEVKVEVTNDSAFAHSWHVHSIHAGTQDGTMTASGMIFPGTSYTYKFIAMPAGLYPYHCHMAPIEEHISRGLYGMMIIDPVKPRPPAAEMVMMMNAYTFSYEGVNGSGHLAPTIPATMQQIRQNLSDVEEKSDENNGPDNQFYTVNGMAFGYTGPNMIQLHTNTPYRIYLMNMVEFDPANSYHQHGAMFYFQESCTPQSARTYTDIVLLQQADRGCVEFNYTLPGEFMIHSHIAHFSDLGWTGFFNVTNTPPPPVSASVVTTSPSLSSLAGGNPSPQEVPSKR